MKKDGKMRLLTNLRDLAIHRWNPKLKKFDVPFIIHVTAPVGVESEQDIIPKLEIDGVIISSIHNGNDLQPELSNLKEQKQPVDDSGIEIISKPRLFIDEEGFDDESRKNIMKIPDIDEILKTNVITICKDGMKTLSDIVSECERMFP